MSGFTEHKGWLHKQGGFFKVCDLIRATGGCDYKIDKEEIAIVIMEIRTYSDTTINVMMSTDEDTFMSCNPFVLTNVIYIALVISVSLHFSLVTVMATSMV